VWYAVMHETGLVVVEDKILKVCSDLAAERWDQQAEAAAPYYLTTIAPQFCAVCEGRGVLPEVHDTWPCQHCEGTGYQLLSNPEELPGTQSGQEGRGDA
jgi:hypothetical protein